MDRIDLSNRRVKGRTSYDLRRKVLLKNFLKEQMSDFNSSSTAASSESANLNTTDADISLENEHIDVEDLDVPDQLSSNNNSSSSQTSDIKEEQVEEVDEIQSIQHEPQTQKKSSLTFNFSNMKISRLPSLRKKSIPSTSEENIQPTANINKIKSRCRIEGIKLPLKSSCDYPNLFKNKCPANKVSKVKRLKKIRDRNLLRSRQISKLAGLPKIKSHTLTIPQLKNQFKNVIKSIKNTIKRKNQLSPLNNFDATDSVIDEVHILNEVSNDNLAGDAKDKHTHDYDKLNKNSKRSYSNDWSETEKYIASKKLKYDSKAWENQNCNRSDKINYQKDLKFWHCKNTRSHSSIFKPYSEIDMSWSINEIRKLEKANQELREENKLLSESLSNIMADMDGVSYNQYRTSRDRDTSSVNLNYDNFHNSRDISAKNWMEPGRTRVLRSQSIQERARRRHDIKSRLSSRSMCHRPYVRTSPKALYKAKPCFIIPHSTDRNFFYQSKFPPIPATADRSCNNGLSRRSSMPEKNTRRPVLNRRLSCASGSASSSYRRNLLALPTTAFN